MLLLIVAVVLTDALISLLPSTVEYLIFLNQSIQYLECSCERNKDFMCVPAHFEYCLLHI